MADSSGPAQALAEVAVSDATVYYDRLYTYGVPAKLSGHIFVGSMVLVPFGRGRARPRTGVVAALRSAPADARTKEIWDAAPEQARLSEELLAIVKYLRETAFCTWFEAVRAVIPRGAQYRAVQDETGWRLESRVARTGEKVYECTEEGRAAAEEAGGGKGAVRLTAKQRAVLRCVKDGAQSAAGVCAACGVTPAVAAGLVKRGLLAESTRDKAAEAGLALTPRGLQARQALPPLSPAQRQVAEALTGAMAQKNPKPALLHGVTASGKTLVFLHLIERALAAGKTALVLVPEIGLTPQMLGVLQAAFGGQVAVQHSGLSPTQRVLQWRSVARGEARVVVGTRSAVFAPLEDIGLVVVDEEQEHTYQSESAPRYDAVDVARRRAARHGALLLLASATPNIATYHAAKETGRCRLFSLRRRYGDVPLPDVEMVDMSAERLGGNAGALSGTLAAAAAQAVAAGRQVILLLNRRGYHRVALCRACGAAVKCPGCSVPMVYHQTAPPAHGPAQPEADGPPGAGRLLCHHCGQGVAPAPAACPECGGPLRYAGFGTQRLEDELAQKLPRARVLRMDMDTTQRKGAHASMLARFAGGEADILLGTQMVAKGLDFERVSLVGVVGIDSLLFGQGYRAFEEVFSLVTQVVGRSGRAGAQGRAIIQTVDPAHPVLRLAAAQDYEAFYREEIAFRKLAMYPPFCALCVVGFAARQEEDAAGAGRAFARLLAARAGGPPFAGTVPLRVLGPVPMQLARQAGSYRYRLTVKCRGDAAFRALAWQTLRDYNEEGWPAKATAWLDFHADG